MSMYIISSLNCTYVVHEKKISSVLMDYAICFMADKIMLHNNFPLGAAILPIFFRHGQK